MIIIRNLNDNTSYSCEIIPNFFGPLLDGYDIGNDRILKKNEIRIIGVNEIEAPIDLKSTLSVKNGGLTVGRDELGRFTPGNKIATGRPRKDEIANKLEEVLESKHYKRKDGSYILAKDLIAEKLIDELINNPDAKLFNAIMERVYGKVRQDIGFAGAIVHGKFTQEDIDRVNKLFGK